ncbi:hypothetical protein [Aurantiacibacter gangjinensis]|uniref:Uncharacterized protein n=1 Tax=Aurantiacibacter gangjinensis TaxID=502682 RepID=A0A0G9MS81_9SPHN|nr:hypothetical protein [Aurantiacibacter gangjinensis]APE28250.1 hypothetical protein BMF35_a1421 [Aurantiacibacter gangjinensis]KLE32143.1 hypothetical protein AAW01_12130 [Aurantiacibacter gangjinensis]
MPERQSRHPDNELIDDITSDMSPSQGSRSGGNVSTRVGTRSDGKRAKDPENREPVVGSDNPEQDAMKGPKTRAAIQAEAES